MNYVQCDPPMARPGAHRHERVFDVNEVEHSNGHVGGAERSSCVGDQDGLSKVGRLAGRRRGWRALSDMPTSVVGR